MWMSFAPPPKKQPVEPHTAREPDFDQDELLDDPNQAEDETDPFAGDDALAALSPEDFYRQLRADVDAVASGLAPGGMQGAHPITPPTQKPRKFSRRATSMNWLGSDRMRRARRY
jgi:hypothetical protein